MVASAGNSSTEQPQYPAAFPGVITVTALDSNNRKLPVSTYGEYVAVSAPGQAIYSADAISDTDRSEYEGTSAAVPLVAAIIALKKRLEPGLSSREIRWLLQNSADPIDSINLRYTGKLGAGKINAEKFLRSDIGESSASNEAALRNPQGAILFRKVSGGFWESFISKTNTRTFSWRLEPIGVFPGIRFRLHVDRKDKSSMRFIPDAQSAKGQVYRFDAVPESLFVPGTGVQVEFTPANPNHEYRWELEYQVVTADSSKLYCRDTKVLDVPDGAFDDGSGPHAYEPYSDCKWLITAPVGRTVKLEFTQFDTEAKKDWVYAFDGSGTNERILGLFSGPNLPPTVSSTGNKMLVWFVTDGQNQGLGWGAHYSFTKP